MAQPDRNEDTSVAAILNWSLLSGVFVLAMCAFVGLFSFSSLPDAQNIYQTASLMQLALWAMEIFLSTSCTVFCWLLIFIGPGRKWAANVADYFLRLFPPK